MELGLTANAFAKLLARLGADEEQAGEKYEDLRHTLIKFFEWRGAPFPEEHADESLNRVAVKLDEGVEIKNIGGYCYQVARLVCLEALKCPDNRRTPIETLNLQSVDPTTPDLTQEKESRLSCLEECLNALPAESRELILDYYQDEQGGKIDNRKILARRLGLRRDALANRAQRMRDKLERCVTNCLRKKPAI